jgi:membrane-bound lytic murein transglycosylase A
VPAIALAIALVIALAGCTTVGPPAVSPVSPPALRVHYAAAEWSSIPGWNDDDISAAWPAFRVGCLKLAAGAATSPAWRGVCDEGALIDSIDRRAVRAFFEIHFSPYSVRAEDDNDTGLITGYYEPLLDGARGKSSRYGIPLFGVPDDLLTIDVAALHPDLQDRRLRGRIEGRRVVPYWSRAEIAKGRAALAGKELAWVENPIDAFFLEIQGSGRIVLDDGTVLRLGFADQNGHPYRSIGRVLVDRGELPLDGASMQAIRDWGRRHPHELPGLLNENPSYVFFREVPPAPPGSLEAAIDGPLGSLGVPLLRERTIAVDRRSIPLGAPVFIATTEPQSERPLQRLVFAQDTGGAIRGAVRADYFLGSGDAAGREAGRMRQQGRLWLLWPKGLPLPR